MGITVRCALKGGRLGHVRPIPQRRLPGERCGLFHHRVTYRGRAGEGRPDSARHVGPAGARRVSQWRRLSERRGERIPARRGVLYLGWHDVRLRGPPDLQLCLPADGIASRTCLPAKAASTIAMRKYPAQMKWAPLRL